jgi:hypothetical protein
MHKAKYLQPAGFRLVEANLCIHPIFQKTSFLLIVRTNGLLPFGTVGYSEFPANSQVITYAAPCFRLPASSKKFLLAARSWQLVAASAGLCLPSTHEGIASFCGQITGKEFPGLIRADMFLKTVNP